VCIVSYCKNTNSVYNAYYTYLATVLNSTRTEISKEELKEFPIKQFEGDIYLLDSEVIPQDVIAYLQLQSILGIDTETKPSFKKGVSHQVSLLQVATEDAVFIFRLHQTGLPKFIIDIFNDPKVIKVGIAVIDDFKDLAKLDRKLKAQGVIDLNVYAQQIGFESIGAKKLSALCLGFSLNKKHQVSNWEAKELSEGQIAYAATDAWICIPIYNKLLQWL